MEDCRKRAAPRKSAAPPNQAKARTEIRLSQSNGLEGGRGGTVGGGETELPSGGVAGAAGSGGAVGRRVGEAESRPERVGVAVARVARARPEPVGVRVIADPRPPALGVAAPSRRG